MKEGLMIADKGIDLAGQCIKIGSQSLQYLDMLTKTVKKEYMTQKIDRYSYERQINIITVIKLQLEQITDLSKQEINQLGAYIDVRI